MKETKLQHLLLQITLYLHLFRPHRRQRHCQSQIVSRTQITCQIRLLNLL
jgi:hypothetical protein